MQRASTRRIVSVAFVVAFVAAGLWFIIEEQDQVRSAAAHVTPSRLLGSLTLGLAAMAAMMLSWTHVVRALGIPLTMSSARGIYPVAQLGKYLPGGVWTLLAQGTLGRQAGFPAAVIASAGALNLALSIGVALLASGLLALGPGAQPFTPLSAVAALMGACILAALSPPIMRRLRSLVVRTRFGSTFIRIMPSSGREMAWAIGWCALAQILCGIHLLVLIPDGRFDLAMVGFATAAYSLAAVAGVLVLWAPAGAGVREGTLVLLLQPVTTPAEALVVTIASRLVLTAADLLLAAMQTSQLRELVMSAAPLSRDRRGMTPPRHDER